MDLPYHISVITHSMAMPSSPFPPLFIIFCSLCIRQGVSSSSPYTAIFSFGDSLADTGNFLISGPRAFPFVARLPYGLTYFGHPTGRCSDGRMIIDFFGTIPFPPNLFFQCGLVSKLLG